MNVDNVNNLVKTSARPIQKLYQLPGELLCAILSSRRPIENTKGTDEKIFPLIDWELVAADANSHAIGVLVYNRLQDLKLDKFLPSTVANSWKADTVHAKLQHVIHRQDAVKISQILTNSRVRHAFIKGFAYRDWLYEPSWIRLGGDIDILVDRCNVEVVRNLLRAQGFVQAAYSEDHQTFRPATAEEIASVERYHHELAEFTTDHFLINPPEWLLSTDFVRRSPFAFGVREGVPVLHSSIDVHWAVHFLFAYETMLDDIVPTSVGEGEVTVPRLSTDWNIVISAFKLYFEAFDRPNYGFNHLIDLSALLELSNEINWNFIDRLVEKYRLGPAMFYTLSAAESISGNRAVPRELMSKWSKRDGAHQCRREAEERVIRDFYKSGIETDLATMRQGILLTTEAVDFGDFLPYLIDRRIGTDIKRIASLERGQL